MPDQGVVERDGFKLEWVREGAGLPMLVVGAQRYYRRVFPPSLRRHIEMVSTRGNGCGHPRDSTSARSHFGTSAMMSKRSDKQPG